MRHWIVPIGLVILVLGFSVFIPWRLGRDAEPFQSKPSALEDSEFADDLVDGHRLERAGKLDEALAKYRLASKAKSQAIREIAEKNRNRVSRKLEFLYLPWEDLKPFVDLLYKIRLPVALIFSVFLLLVVMRRIIPRKGMGIGPFAVFGTVDSSASAGFNRFLFDDLTEIRKVYSSTHLRRIGTLATSDILLLMSEEREDVWTRALSSAREAELKSMVAFSLGELIRFVKGLAARPSYSITGRVCLVPGEACVVAELTDLRNKKMLIRCEASSTEIQQVTASLPGASVPATGSLSGGTLAARSQWIDDYRQNQKQLSDAATVVACKIWWRLAQSAQAEFRPQTWRTVFYFVQALGAMESY
jgi:hypothetical protein